MRMLPTESCSVIVGMARSLMNKIMRKRRRRRMVLEIRQNVEELLLKMVTRVVLGIKEIYVGM